MNLKKLKECISKFSPKCENMIYTDDSYNFLNIAFKYLIAEIFGADPKNIIDIIDKINSNPESENIFKEIEKMYDFID